MRQARVLAVLALSALATSLAWAQKINVEFDQNADFSKYRTFAVRSGPPKATNAALNNDINRKRIESDIAKALIAKGLTQAVGRPDLIVRYRLGASRRTEVERYPAGWRGLRTRTVRTGYSEGTLVINMRDRAANSLVWRATATEDKSNAGQIADKLDDMVRKALNKYPPK